MDGVPNNTAPTMLGTKKLMRENGKISFSLIVKLYYVLPKREKLNFRSMVFTFNKKSLKEKKIKILRKNRP